MKKPTECEVVDADVECVQQSSCMTCPRFKKPWFKPSRCWLDLKRRQGRPPAWYM